MPDKDDDLQEFIDEVSSIKNNDYDAFLKIKYIVEGVKLAKKSTTENPRACIS